MVYNLFRFSINSLIKNKLRTFLCGLCISVGVTAVLVIWCISNAGKDAVNNELDNMGFDGVSITATNGKLTNTDLALIKLQKTVNNAVPVIFSNCKIEENGFLEKAICLGVDANAKAIIALDVIHGREVSKGDVDNKANVCIIDSKTAEIYFNNENAIGKSININLNGKNKSFEIIGVANAKSSLIKYATDQYIPATVYLPYSTVQAIKGKKELNQIIVKFYDSDDINSLASDVVSKVTKNYGKNEYDFQDLASQRVGLDKTLNIITTVFLGVGALSLLVASIGCMTVMLICVSSRTREIGIRKAIGENRISILLSFVLEAVIMFTFFATVGAALSYVIIEIINMLFNTVLQLSAYKIIIVVLINAFFGCVFGLLPAVKASKMLPVNALRN